MVVFARRRWVASLPALAAMLAASSGCAQTAGQEPTSTIKENVHLVVVPVAVKDRRGNLVDDLTEESFRVLEDGRERPLRYFSNETVPLSAVILLDAGMSEQQAAIVRASLGSLRHVFAPTDEAALFLFDNTIREVQDFTSESDVLADLAQKNLPEGRGPSLAGGPLSSRTVVGGVPIDRPGASPFPARPVGKRISDALYTAANRLKARPAGHRRVVVIVSDGVNGSDNTTPENETMNALAAAEVTVYAVSFGTGWALKRKDWLARVAHETGGDIAYVQRRSGLDRVLYSLTNEARNSYVLGFPPASADGEFHEIVVRVARRGVRLIARNRFFAPPLK